MAQREVWTYGRRASGDEGISASVFAMLPKLLERSGMSMKGSITGIYTVLVDGMIIMSPLRMLSEGSWMDILF